MTATLQITHKPETINGVTYRPANEADAPFSRFDQYINTSPMLFL